jgi:LuxR family maltose regulon positive regulatory protein
LLLTIDIDYMEARINDAIRAFGLPRNFWVNWPVNLSKRDEGLLGEIVALSMYVTASRGNTEQAIHLAEQGLENIGNDNVLCRSVIAEILGDIYRDIGNVPLAIKAYYDSLNYGQAASNELAKMISLDGIAWMHLVGGNLPQAETLFRQVIALQIWQGQPLLPVAKSYVGLGLLLKEQNNLAEAEPYLLQGVTQCELGGYVRHLFTALSGLASLKAAKGEITESLAIAEQTIRLARTTSLDWTLSNALALRATLWLHPGINDFSAALQWLDNCGLSSADIPEYSKEMEYLAFVRVHLARCKHGLGKDGLPDLLKLLERLLDSAEKCGRKASQISILLLQALVFDESGQTPRALLALDKALKLAIPSGFKRIFLNEGMPVKLLLQKELTRGIHTAFVEELLASFGKTDSLFSLPELVEPLTEREVEFLRLMAHGLTNREICAELNISMGTANTHARHLFRKLGIHSRSQAVGLAREMGLVR